nr:MAG TPA: hypothetical protein [Caudoviricetes sp.]
MFQYQRVSNSLVKSFQLIWNEMKSTKFKIESGFCH